jgi:DNA repair exonuclease SbcCD ATPase subunit
MGIGKRLLKIAGILGVGVCVVFSANAFAQEGTSTASDTVAPGEPHPKDKKEWKQEISSDAQQIKQARETNKSHAQAAIKKEKDLRDQIRQAVQAGDQEKARSLREQLKATHKENIQQKRQDMQNLKQTRQELRSDIKDARKDGALPPRKINPPGVGPDNPPGVGPGRPLPPPNGDRREDVRDRREDIRDRREDIRDAKHDGGRMDRIEDRLDRREDRRDRREDVRDRREDRRDRHEPAGDRGFSNGQNSGVRDHGAGIGAGRGQGGLNRSGGAGGGRRR